MSAPDQQRQVDPLAMHGRVRFTSNSVGATCQLQTFRAPFESSQCIRQISPPGTLNR